MRATAILATFAFVLAALPADGAPFRMKGFAQREYQSACATCHGADGRGVGEWSDLLAHDVPDLTQIARRNGGFFPAERVYRRIDGRHDSRPYHVREMPAWGAEYAAWGQQCSHPEAFATTRITALVEYLRRIQR